MAELVLRAARGDEAAFADLYDDVSPLVWGIVSRVLRNRAQAEEVVQEVFLDLWRQAPRFDPQRGSARGWAATIAHRRAVDRVRSEEAARLREGRTALLETRQERSEPDPVAVIEQDLVRRAVAGLPPAERQALELAYFGGHSYRSVARLLEVPEGTVKTRIRTGLKRLRMALGAGS